MAEEWRDIVEGDITLLRCFYSPLLESFNLTAVCNATTKALETLLEYVYGSLVMALKVSFVLGGDQPKTPDGKRFGGVPAAAKVNEAWVELPRNRDWESRLAGTDVPVVRVFETHQERQTTCPGDRKSCRR